MLALVLLIVYLGLMVALGIWGMVKTKNLNDFFLGGRQIGPVVSALSYGTTYFSAVLFIGFAGKLGWGFGLRDLWIAVGNVLVGSLLAWLVLAHRTRVMTHNLNVMTMPEFFEARFGSSAMRIFSATIIFIFLLPYSASVYKGLAHLFEVNFNIPYETAVFIMTAITGIYLVLGGYFAVTITDFVQGLIMLVGSIAMVAVLTTKAGGFMTAIQTIQANYPLHVPPAKQPGWLLLGALVFMTSFGTWGLPQMVQKFYSIKNEKVIRTAALVTTLFALVIVFVAYYTGALAHVFMDKPPLTGGKPNFDMIIPEMLKTHLPPGLMALILLLILSASMSTLASLVLVSSSAIAIDIYQQHRASQAKHDFTLRLMRWLNALFVLLSMALAIYPFDVIVTLMSLSWGAVAGAFMAPYLYGLFWKRATQAGVWAGMASGLAIAVVFFFAWGPNNSPISASLAMIVPFAIVPVVSWLTRAPEAGRLDRAFAGLGRPAART